MIEIRTKEERAKRVAMERKCFKVLKAILDSDAPNAVELTRTPNGHKGTRGMTDEELEENLQILTHNYQSIKGR